MALTTVVVNGNIHLPDGAVPDSATLEFRLVGNGFDMDSNEVIPQSFIADDLNVSTGAFTANLWPNDRGSLATYYQCILTFTGSSRGKRFSVQLGDFQVPEAGAPHEFATLRTNGVVSANSVIVSQLTQNQYDAVVDTVVNAEAVESYATQAEAARDAAFVNADVYVDTTAGLADTVDGDQFQVVSGSEIIRYENDAGSAVEVARYPSADLVIDQANEYTANLFNPNDPDYREGYKLSTTGGLISDAAYDVTGFMDVLGSTDYVFSSEAQVAWYDASKTFISRYNPGSAHLLKQTSPSNAAFARAAWIVEYERDGFMFSQGSVEAPYVGFGLRPTVDVMRNQPSSAIADGAVIPQKLSWASVGKNKFNPDDPDVLIGYYSNAAGNYVATATYNVTGFIDVVEGETYVASGAIRFLTAYDEAGSVVEASGSNVQISTYTVPAGIKKVRISCFAYDWDTLQIEVGSTPTGYEPFRYELDATVKIANDAVLPAVGVSTYTDPRVGKGRLRHVNFSLLSLERGLSSQLNIALVGDSFTHSRERWCRHFSNRLFETYGDGGGGWTGYSFGVAGTTPYVVGGSKPSLINANVRRDSEGYDMQLSGNWTATYQSTVSPDLGMISSSTAGDYVYRTVPATPDHTALRVVYIGTADGVVRYRVDSGVWSSNVDVQGTVGNIGTFDIALTGGAHTIEIEVVSGTVNLCGDNALSDADGVRVHKLGSSGSAIDDWTDRDETQQLAAWSALGPPEMFVLFDATNSRNEDMTPATWKTNMETMVSRVKSLGVGSDILIVVPADNGVSATYAMSQYRDAAREIALNDARVAFLDLQEYFGAEWADYSSTADFPLYSADNIHPDSATGGRIMTSAIYDFVVPTRG